MKKQEMNLTSLKNMQEVFNLLAEIKLTKKNREQIVGMIQAAFVNGYNDALTEKVDYSESEFRGELDFLVGFARN